MEITFRFQFFLSMTAKLIECCFSSADHGVRREPDGRGVAGGEGRPLRHQNRQSLCHW